MQSGGLGTEGRRAGGCAGGESTIRKDSLERAGEGEAAGA